VYCIRYTMAIRRNIHLGIWGNIMLLVLIMPAIGTPLSK